MKRRYRREVFAERLKKVREFIPNAFIGVDVIVGFPGETEDIFNDAYSFIESQQPSFLHIFPYSERANTPAISYNGKVKPADIKLRLIKLSALSDKLHRDFYEKNIGLLERVLFESTRKGGLMCGFTENYIKVETPYDKLLVGKIVNVKMIGISPDGNMDVEIL